MIWLYIVSSIILLLIAVIDYETEEIPHTLTIALLVCGIISIILNRENFMLPLISSLGFFAFLVLMFFIGNIGGGDVKILCITCLFLYTLEIMLFYLIIFSIVLFFGIVKSILKGEKSLRLGPYMAIPLILTFVFIQCGCKVELLLSYFLLSVTTIITLDVILFSQSHLLKLNLFKKE